MTVRQGARSAGADPELQDDVVQHVFARLGGRFTEDPELCERQFTRSYLWRQGRDRVLDYLRSSWHQKRVDAAPDFETWGTESAGSAGDRSSPQVGGISSGWWTSNPETDTTSLRVAMGRLEEPYRWAARLRWGLGWKLDEIAAFLSKSRRRTEQYLSRAKEDVADILRGESST